MRLTFAPDTHTYTLDGAIVPSVTQVLRASGLIDYSQGCRGPHSRRRWSAERWRRCDIYAVLLRRRHGLQNR